MDSADFIRFLAAKKSVEDRALNAHVWRALLGLMGPGAPDRPRAILEVGAGIGAMAERLRDAGCLDGADYTAIDADVRVIANAKRRLDSGRANNAWRRMADSLFGGKGQSGSGSLR